jgi:hypothetical protein
LALAGFSISFAFLSQKQLDAKSFWRFWRIARSALLLPYGG